MVKRTLLDRLKGGRKETAEKTVLARIGPEPLDATVAAYLRAHEGKVVQYGFKRCILIGPRTMENEQPWGRDLVEQLFPALYRNDTWLGPISEEDYAFLSLDRMESIAPTIVVQVPPANALYLVGKGTKEERVESGSSPVRGASCAGLVSYRDGMRVATIPASRLYSISALATVKSEFTPEQLYEAAARVLQEKLREK